MRKLIILFTYILSTVFLLSCGGTSDGSTDGTPDVSVISESGSPEADPADTQESSVTDTTALPDTGELEGWLLKYVNSKGKISESLLLTDAKEVLTFNNAPAAVKEKLKSIPGGARISVLYDGIIQESFPAQFHPADVSRIEEAGTFGSSEREAVQRLTDLGYYRLLMETEEEPFLLMDHPVEWTGLQGEYSYDAETGKKLEVVLRMERTESGDDTVYRDVPIVSFELSSSGDETAGDDGTYHQLLRKQGDFFLHVFANRYAWYYISGNNTVNAFEEDKKMPLELTDEEMLRLIETQTNKTDIDWTTLREEYRKASEEKDTDKLAEINRSVNEAYENLNRIGLDNIWIAGADGIEPAS